MSADSSTVFLVPVSGGSIWRTMRYSIFSQRCWKHPIVAKLGMSQRAARDEVDGFLRD
jgi:hypothetical protein